MASRNSHCDARGRGKRPVENPKNQENSWFWIFLGALFPYKLLRIVKENHESKKFTRFFSSKNIFFRFFRFFIFVTYFISSLWKFHFSRTYQKVRKRKSLIFSLKKTRSQTNLKTNFLVIHSRSNSSTCVTMRICFTFRSQLSHCFLER